MEHLQRKINEIRNLKSNLHGKDFLLTWDKTVDEIELILAVAESLKLLRDNNVRTCCFQSGLAVSNFRDNSTRTRFSFASACNLLGLTVQDIDEAKSQIAHGETVRETSTMISFLTEVIGIRDDMYLGEGHSYMLEVAQALDEGFAEGVLPQRPTVINLQCDYDHPTQTMSDLLHLKNHFGSFEALKGKKIAMTWAYSPSYGKPLSVPQGIVGLLTRFGMNVELAHPAGYELLPEVKEIAAKNALDNAGTFVISNDMENAFEGADIVYPKSWAPFEVMRKRTELLKSNNVEGLKGLEKECLDNNARFRNWECDSNKMKLTKGGNALYMHCLPADISGVSCEKGEVSSDIFEQYRLETYKEAGYKPYIIAAMILSSRFANPVKIIEKMMINKVNRIFE